MTTTFIPTTTVAVQRGTTKDRYGEDVDTAAVVATGVPVCVTEGNSGGRGSQQSGRPVDGRAGGVVGAYTIRLRPLADVVEQDRLLDEFTGVTYQVTAVYRPASVVGAADVRVDAIRVAATSSP